MKTVIITPGQLSGRLNQLTLQGGPFGEIDENSRATGARLIQIDPQMREDQWPRLRRDAILPFTIAPVFLQLGG